MVSLQVEYVAEDDVLADIALKTSTSVSLRTTNAILLALLLLASYVLNIILLCTVYTSRKMRTSLIYLMFCHIAIINMLDLSLSVLLSLLNIANGIWIFGDGWCRVNATVQEFCQLYMLMTLTVIVVERATELVTEFPMFTHQKIIQGILTKKHVLGLSLVLLLVCLAVVIPIATGALFVKPFRNRYVCAIGSGASLGYTLARLLIFAVCLCVILVCTTAIFRKREGRSLPQQTHDYSDFIRRNRAKQELLSRAKLAVLLVCIYVLVEGPYISLCLTYEIFTSILTGGAIDIPQDLDTLITWLKFVFPLLSPIAILCWCSDISGGVKELFLCRSYDPPIIGPSISGYKGIGTIPGVMTLVATHEGLQLKLPTSDVTPSMPDFSPEHANSPHSWPQKAKTTSIGMRGNHNRQ
ncbi:G protein-coupled receptor [Trichostrongylus colubriformis]|uniref:G protein-coupled receptor n=1 Tax=Trichostrongylus colubriformis TaxID=6319 RepID=A0AAN8I8M0_TRICO